MRDVQYWAKFMCRCECVTKQREDLPVIISTVFCQRRPVFKYSTCNVETLDNCVISAVLMKFKVFCDVTLCRRGYSSLYCEGSYCLVS